MNTDLASLTDLGGVNALELAPDGVIIVDAEGRITYANRNCQQVLGWTPEELLGECIDRLVPGRFPRHAALREKYTATASLRPMGAGLKLCALHRSGAEVPVDIALNPVMIAGVPHVVVALRDMRPYRAALHELDMLSVAVNAAAGGVVITGTEGVITWVNPAACRMTGYAASELVGSRPSLLKSGRHDPVFYQQLWETVRSGAVWRGLMINRTRSGSEYHEEQTIAPVRGADGTITHFIAIKQDVTERVQAEAQLREARDQLTRHVAEVERLHVELREQALRDSLSGLYNRRYLDETLIRELAKASWDRTPVTLVMLDLDHFKILNDTHGHAAGDRVIAALGGVLRRRTRMSDVACRYGGEEFAVVLLGAELQAGINSANDWRGQLGAVSRTDGIGGGVTFSAGVVQWRPGETGQELIARADAALYRAKRAGRNTVVGE